MDFITTTGESLDSRMMMVAITADVMKRIAAPMIGGLITSFIMELVVYPAIYKLWKRRHLPPSSSGPIPGTPQDSPSSATALNDAEVRATV